MVNIIIIKNINDMNASGRLEPFLLCKSAVNFRSLFTFCQKS